MENWCCSGLYGLLDCFQRYGRDGSLGNFVRPFLSVVLPIVALTTCVRLNAISLVNIVISVGIAVEFCSHIARAFMGASGGGLPFDHPAGSRDRDERSWTALVEVGSSASFFYFCSQYQHASVTNSLSTSDS